MDLIKEIKRFKTPAAGQTPSKGRVADEQEVPSSPQGNEPSSPDLADLGLADSPTRTCMVAEDKLEEKCQMLDTEDEKEYTQTLKPNDQSADKVTASLSQEEWDDLFTAVISKPPEEPTQKADPGAVVSADDFESLMVDAKQVVEDERSRKVQNVIAEQRERQQQDHGGEDCPDKTPAVSGQNTPECHTPQKPSKQRAKKKKKLHPKQLFSSETAGKESDSANAEINRQKKKRKTQKKLVQSALSADKSIYDFTEESRQPSSTVSSNMKPRKQGKKRKSKRETFLSREIEEQGTWVQCTAEGCNKWRYLAEVTDPATVPDKWTCSMNTDEEYNRCEKIEVDWSQLEFVDTLYVEGSLVWARMAGYPWWPGMVEEDPDDQMYYETDSKQRPVSYHVIFFGKKVSRAWIPERFVRPFTGQDDVDHFGSLVFDGKNYRKRVQAATAMARQAAVLSIKKRLQTFGFGQRFQGHWGRQDVSDEDDKEPPEKAPRKGLLQEEEQTTAEADLSDSGSVADLMEQAEKVLGNAESFLSSVQTKDEGKKDGDEEYEYSPGKVMKISDEPPSKKEQKQQPKVEKLNKKRKGKKSDDDEEASKKKKKALSDEGSKKSKTLTKEDKSLQKVAGLKKAPTFKPKMKKIAAPQKESSVNEIKPKNQAKQALPAPKPKKPNFKPPRSKKAMATNSTTKDDTDKKGNDDPSTGEFPFPFDSEIFTMEMESQEESCKDDLKSAVKNPSQTVEKTSDRQNTDQKVLENDNSDMVEALYTFEKSNADVPDDFLSAPSSPSMDLPDPGATELPEPDVPAVLDSCVPVSPAMELQDLETALVDSIAPGRPLMDLPAAAESCCPSSPAMDLPKPDVSADLDRCVPGSPDLEFVDSQADFAPGSPLMDLPELDSDCHDASCLPVQGAEEFFGDNSQPFDLEE